MRRLFIASVALCLILCGCAEAESLGIPSYEEYSISVEEEAERRAERDSLIEKGLYMQKVYHDEDYNIDYFRDTRTDVMYLCYIRATGYGSGVGITVMYKSDGMPLTYEEWKQMEESNG